MAGRHRRPPAWRRMLLRLRRTDRAARFAALQAEVVALRATVAGLRTELASAHSELGAVRAATAAAVAAASEPAMPPMPASTLRWVGLDLPLVQAVQPSLAMQPAGPESPGETTIEIDLREIIAEADIVLSALPEAALLDPKQARDVEISDPAIDVRPAAERRTA